MIVSWIGKDPHGIASSYIASDSAISFPNGQVFRVGRKVFASKKYPDIFAFCGDVIFPSLILGQLIEQIDSGLLFFGNETCSKRDSIVSRFVERSLLEYPKNWKHEASILHISREIQSGYYPAFHAYEIDMSFGGTLPSSEIPLPSASGLLIVLGSGKEEFEANYQRYQIGNNKDTSRNVFHCFLQTLYETKTYSVDGAPQLVGLSRKPNTGGTNYGIIYKNERFFLGQPVGENVCFGNVEWRNERFELCDGRAMMKKTGAACQPNVSWHTK